MGEILGLGMTHFPPLTGRDTDMGWILKRALQDPALPEHYRQPSGWPAAMRQEYGDDEGMTAAVRHREFLVTQFRKARQILDDFQPDFVVLWGDDQYENFKEDIIPPFCVFAYDAFAPTRGRVEAPARTPGTSPKRRLSHCVGIARPLKLWPRSF